MFMCRSITSRVRQAVRSPIALPPCRLHSRTDNTGAGCGSTPGPGRPGSGCGAASGCNAGSGASSGTGSSSSGSGSKGTPSEYEKRKFQHELSKNDTKPPFDVPKAFPSGVFRCTENECLGPCAGADKAGEYKNPEYFSFHSSSFADINLALQQYRLPVADLKRKP